MGSGIEVYFTKVNMPWANADPGKFWVNVYAPDGPEVVGVPAPSGHVSIDLPPGRYLVTGTLQGVYVNFDSNETLVNVGCEDRVCVTIIPRSLHFCVWWLSFALDRIAQNPQLAPELKKLARPAIQALAPIEKAIPDEFRQLAFLTEGAKVLKRGASKTASRTSKKRRAR